MRNKTQWQKKKNNSEREQITINEKKGTQNGNVMQWEGV